MVNLELYRVFITVAEEGSFTLAARRLMLTQSAVSQAVGQLERLLETRLFLRGARGVSLTESGQVLLDHVGGLLRGVDAAQQYFAQLKGLEGGSLRIGASDTLCRHVLLPHLKAFRRRYPRITLHVTNRTSGETAELLRGGLVDIGFVNLPLEGLSEFEVHEIMALQDCFVCGDELREAFSGVTPLEALRQHPLLMLETQSASRRYMDAWLRREGHPLAPEIELGSLDLLLDFAQAGLGVAAVVREFTGHRLGRGLWEVKLAREPAPRQVGLLLRRGAFSSRATRAFMEIVRAPAPPGLE